MQHARDDYNTRIQDSAGKIPADEPVFLLRAQDPYAADAVQCWLNNYLSLTQEPDPVVVQQVQEHIGRMREYQPKKSYPDLPDPEPPQEHCVYCGTTELEGIYVRHTVGGKAGTHPSCRSCWEKSRGGPAPAVEPGEPGGMPPKEPLTDVDPPPAHVPEPDPNDDAIADFANEMAHGQEEDHAPSGDEEGTSSADAPPE